MLRVYSCPGRFFERLDPATPYGRPMALLMILLGLAGYVGVAAGLVEREVDLATERDLARIEREAIGEISADQLDQRFKSARDAALFWKVIVSGASVLAVPGEVTGRILIGATVAFVFVALSGRKPSYHALVAILTFAACTELLRQAVVVPLMLHLSSTEVETSLAVLARGRAEYSGWRYTALQTIDPFDIWFCCLAALGINRSGQLSARGAAVLGIMLWSGGAAMHVGSRFVLALAGGEVLS